MITRTKKWLGLSAALGLNCAAYAGSTVDDAITDFSPSGMVEFIFSAERLMSVFVDKLQAIGDATLGFAFLCLVVPSIYGLIKRGIHADTVNSRVLRPLVLCGLVASVATTKTIFTTGFDALAAAVGYEGPDLLHKYYAETKIFIFPKTAAEVRDDLATDDRAALLSDVVALLAFLKDFFVWSADNILVVPAAVLLSLFSFSVAVGTFLAEFVRTSCLEIGYAIFPLFVAGINSAYFRLAAIRALLRLLSLHAWTAIWSLTGAVTIGVVHMLHRYIDSLYTTIGDGPTPMGGFFLLFANLPFGVVVFVIGVMAVAAAWHISSLVLGPLVFSRLLAHGGLVLERWAGASAPSILPPSVIGSAIAPTTSVRSLGVLFRATLESVPVSFQAPTGFLGSTKRGSRMGASLPDASQRVLSRFRK